MLWDFDLALLINFPTTFKLIKIGYCMLSLHDNGMRCSYGIWLLTDRNDMFKGFPTLFTDPRVIIS